MALRSTAVPLVLGLRIADPRSRAAHAEVPPPRLRLGQLSKALLDEIFFATEVMSAPVVGLRDAQRIAREIGEALALYAARGWLDAPASFHRSPEAARPRGAARLASSPWGEHRHLRFESGYEPHAGEPGRERWLGYAPNRTAHAWLLEHRGRRRPWLVCIPGYRMGHPMVDFTGFRAQWLHRELGLNVAIPVLPFHGPRSVGSRGGDGFLSGDFLDTVHAQAQAVWDVRRLIGWLRATRADTVGAYGISLGGYTAALVASLDATLDCVVAGIPAADFVRLYETHAAPIVRGMAASVGLPIERVKRLLRVVSPLALPPRVPHARRFVFAAVRARLAPPDHARDLWLHWERPQMRWYEGSHVSFFFESDVKALLRDAFSQCGLLPAEPRRRGTPAPLLEAAPAAG
jgi:hypothetical protein